jgi:hypothetical protein
MSVPKFIVDPAWPKPLPNHWLVGAVVGVAVDSRDHIWITHRPSTLQPNETRSFWKAAPPVLEFAQDGTLVSSWGGPGAVDGRNSSMASTSTTRTTSGLRRRRQGRAHSQVHAPGQVPDADRPSGQGRGATTRKTWRRRTWSSIAPPTNCMSPTGHVNHRVVVFDATSGAYKRHWGAYGKRPDDSYFTKAGEVLPGPFSGAVQHENKPSQYDPKGPPPPQFRIVHAVRISNDGLVYVCDRTNDRLQVFKKDGTFIQEAFIARDTFGSGSVWDIGFSTDPAQTFAIVIDGTNQQVYVLDRKTLSVVSTFGSAGHWAGQFYGAHNLAVDSKGNLYITETYEGKRVQRFTWVR